MKAKSQPQTGLRKGLPYMENGKRKLIRPCNYSPKLEKLGKYLTNKDLMSNYNLIPIKTEPVLTSVVTIPVLLSKRSISWVIAELKCLNLKFGSYLAFEKGSFTHLYSPKIQKVTNKGAILCQKQLKKLKSSM